MTITMLPYHLEMKHNIPHLDEHPTYYMQTEDSAWLASLLLVEIKC